MTGTPSRRIVVGVGNADRGDDAAGRAVIERLRAMPCGDVEIAEVGGEPTALLAELAGAESAFLVDACTSGAAAGTVRRFDVGQTPLPERVFGLSTHGLGLAEALELARALGELPPRCVVYAIEGASFEMGTPLTPAVARAVDRVVERLYAELESRATERSFR